MFSQILESKFDFVDAQKQGFSEPSNKLMKSGNPFLKDFPGFSMIASSIEEMKPNDKASIYDYVNHIFIMVAIIIIISIPFVPDEIMKIIFGNNLVKLGTILTLLSLTIIFITGFIRNHYNNKIDKIRLQKYYEMKKVFDDLHFWFVSIQKQMENEKDQFTSNLNDFSELMKIGIKLELEKGKKIDD